MFLERATFKQFFSENDKITEVFSFANNYKEFLHTSKTERESIQTSIKLAQKAGYIDGNSIHKAKPGDKIYFVNREKNVALFHIGKHPLQQGINIVASHVDSPRLDLKPMPLQEDSDLALLKTHYYGGIKKFHWVSKPLALHGIVILQDGTKVDIIIGEDKNDPVFMIPDIEPHLSRFIQNDRKATEIIKGEEMQIIVGSLPLTQDNKNKNAVKQAILKILEAQYNIREEDLLSAELSAVPAGKARDVGFDRSMIGAYGHDDKSCVFSSLKALIDQKDIPEKTSMIFLVDKEEIGSTGSTGMQSDYFIFTINKLLELTHSPVTPLATQEVLWNSTCISADVKPAYDPIFSTVYDESNTAKINGGVSITKYTGVRGKSGASDADAELVAGIRRLLSSNNIPYQWGTSGKVDEGGGGTVAKFIAMRGVRTIDLGLPIFSMHAPYEIASKFDIYSYYLAIKAFLNQGVDTL